MALSGQVKEEMGTECLMLWQKNLQTASICVYAVLVTEVWETRTELELDCEESLQADNKSIKSRQEWWGYLVAFGERDCWTLCSRVAAGCLREMLGCSRAFLLGTAHTWSASCCSNRDRISEAAEQKPGKRARNSVVFCFPGSWYFKCKS